MWAPGDVVLGVYEVRDVVRTGGMGLVYRVRHLQWGVDLAVKMPRPELVASPEDLAGFEEEAGAWVRLGAHPHVVNCVYVRRIDGAPRVFAEWVGGGTLADAVRDRRLYRGGHQEAVGRLLDVAAQVAWGLDHAHRHGLVHQDVKPANVMVETDGTAKVTDFGLARAREAGTGGTGTDPLVSFGGMTPAYCSPEQARAERLSEATDVWSWAVSVLEMFVGRPPSYFGQAAAQVFEQFVSTGVEDPVIPRMPDPVADMLRRCFAADPAARPSSLGEVADELTRIYRDMTGDRYPRELPSEAQLLADGLSNQALSLLDLGDPDQAEELWERALHAEPRHPHATYNRGLRRWRAGLLTDRELIAELEGVRTSRGGGGIGDYLLSLVHLERGDKRHALRQLRDLPDSPEVAAVRVQADRLPDNRPSAVLQRSTTLRRPVFAVSADGRVAAVSHEMRDLRVWDLDTVTPVRVLSGHRTPLQSAALSADGRVLVSGDDSGHVRVWDAVDGSCRRRYDLPPHGVESVAVSGDGSVVAVAGVDGSVRVLADTVRVISEAFDNYGQGFGGALTLTADGARVLSFDGYRWLLRMWDLRTGELLGGMNRLNRRFAFSPGGRFALAVTEEETVRLVDLSTAAVRDLGSAAAWGGGPIAVTDDGRVGLSTDGDFGLQKWLLDHNRCVFTGESDPGADVSVSADGRVALLSIPEGESVGVVWPPPAGPPAPWSYARPGSATRLIEDARTADTIMDRAAVLLDSGRHADAWDQLQMVRAAVPGYRRHPRLLPLWRRAGAAAGRSGFAGAWRTRTFERLLRGQTAITQDLRRAITGRYDGSVAVYDLETGREKDAAEGHDTEVRWAALCADDQHAITKDLRGVHMVWELSTARRVATLFQPDDGPVRLGAHNGLLAVTSRKGEPTCLWDSTSRRPLFVWPGPGHRFATLSGNVAVTLAENGHARVLDVQDGLLLRTARFRMEEAEEDMMTAAVSSDGRVVVATQRWYPARGIIQLSHTDLPDVGSRTVSSGSVNCLALTPDGELLLTGSSDHTVRLWEIRTGNLICDLEGNTEAVYSVALSDDGCHAVSSDNLGTVLRWELDWEYTRPAD
ncbi:protein kinase [Streptomyces sp. NPDC058239]|uniref:protein kinase domain-containing protein n=1 Tax=Streptomyces sp. NPDC058239 TaxID=3346395 RepID=UPI0036E13BD0